MDTKKTFTTSYHPQCDGLVERFNGTLAQSLSHYVNSSQKDWDRYLNPVLFGYRVSPSEVTGESPFFLLYGRQPRLPMDVSMLPPREVSASIAEHRARVVENIEIAHRIAKENIQRAQQRMKDYHDVHAVPIRHQVGDSVWVYMPCNRKGLSKKLAHNWHGPYKIVEFLSPVHCILRATDNCRVSTTVHVSCLQRYVSPDSRPIRQPPELVEESYLAENDLPSDSFVTDNNEVLPESPTPDQEVNTGQPTPDTDECATGSSPTLNETRPQAAPRTRSQTSETRNPIPSALQAQEADSPRLFSDPAPVPDNVYQVEKLLKQRMKDGEHQFLVKWLGFPSSQNSWEPADNILDKRLIATFYKNHPRANRLQDSNFHARIAPLNMVDAPTDNPIIAALSVQHKAMPEKSWSRSSTTRFTLPHVRSHETPSKQDVTRCHVHVTKRLPSVLFTRGAMVTCQNRPYAFSGNYYSYYHVWLSTP